MAMMLLPDIKFMNLLNTIAEVDVRAGELFHIENFFRRIAMHATMSETPIPLISHICLTTYE